MVCFQTKNRNSGYILEGLGMENVGIQVHIMTIWNTLRPFGIIYGRLL
jgi:hypothetical protein